LRHLVTLGFIITAAVGSAAAGSGYSLKLEEELDRPRVDPRTDARLAQWNSPIGRVAHHMQQEHASLMGGGQPGGGAIGLGFRVKFQAGVRPELIVASTESGVEFYERAMAVIRWPWAEDDDRPVLPTEEQLALLLGRRLEAHTAGHRVEQD
jgi:hypothetical protein